MKSICYSIIFLFVTVIITSCGTTPAESIHSSPIINNEGNDDERYVEYVENEISTNNNMRFVVKVADFSDESVNLTYTVEYIETGCEPADLHTQQYLEECKLLSQEFVTRLKDWDLSNRSYAYDTVKWQYIPGKYLSIIHNVENNVASNAHPYHNVRVWNYDLHNDRLLTAADVFSEDAAPVLSNHVYNHIMERYGHPEMHTDYKETLGTLSTYDHFSLTPDGLKLFFDEYLLASWSSLPTFDMVLSYDLINDCLQPWVLDLVTDGDFQVDQNNRESDPSPTIVNGQESRRISGYWDFVGYDASGWDFFYDSLFISPTDNVYRITDVYGKVNKGTFSVLDDKLTFSTNAGSSDTFTYKLDGNRLTLIWDNVPNSEIYILYFNRTDENNSESVTSEPNINIKVGEKVTDFKATDVNGTTYYDDYLKYYQCVSYAFARAREKLGFLAACEMIPGFRVVSAKDTAVIAEKYNGRSCINHSSGKNYIITVFNYANLNPDEIKTRVKSDLLPNSYASFNSLGTNSVDGGHGHIIFVEDVVSEDGTLYVYFSEGGNTRHELDGVLQKITFNELVERGGGLNGIVAFELRN